MEVAYRKRCSLERMLCLSREMRDMDKEKHWDYERGTFELPPRKWFSG